MKSDMRYVDWRRTNFFKLLLELEETVLDFFLDIVRQIFLCADKFRVLRVPTLLHDTASRTMESLLELVDAPVGHRHLLVALDLLGCLGSYTVDGWTRRIHACHCGWRCLVSSDWVIGLASARVVLVHISMRLLFDRLTRGRHFLPIFVNLS